MVVNGQKAWQEKVRQSGLTRDEDGEDGALEYDALDEDEILDPNPGLGAAVGTIKPGRGCFAPYEDSIQDFFQDHFQGSNAVESAKLRS